MLTISGVKLCLVCTTICSLFNNFSESPLALFISLLVLDSAWKKKIPTQIKKIFRVSYNTL